ncbi:MAG: PAS domain S-box protein [Methanobrevibacter sp.]|uniref:PAS domain S-box protein n=1 Tax=Methanobrevibacter sp. TaxID=66852 RepID=UPI0025F1CA64|nr:PAS domain S-box protein [Methanobrevibacter sp.]MBR0270541.1 PAS domain S-box protein [Methanobrevibacter sp.]
MKIAYFNYDEEKLFEIKVDKLESIEDEYLIKDVPKTDDETRDFLGNLDEEIYVLLPYNDGEDFYLKSFNHSNYFKTGDNNFKIGSLISHTVGRQDEENNFVKMFQELYRTGKKKTGILKYMNDDGKLIKYLDFCYFMMGDKIISIHKDKTEVKMYRESTLDDEHLGVAIVQNNRFVELNENYARYVGKTREQMLGSPYSLKGMPPENRETVKKQIELISKQKIISYKVPLVAYNNDGSIRFFLNAEGSYISYDNMPAVLIKIRDLTQQEKDKNRIENDNDSKTQLKYTFKSLADHSKTVISYGIYPDKFFVSDNFYDVIEDESRSYQFNPEVVRDFLLGEDMELYDSMMDTLSPANPEVEFTTSIMTLNLNIKYIRHHIKRIYDSEGNAQSYVSSHQDITEEASYTNALKKQIYDKNEIIKDKDIDIKEAHHNIKNNLNILLSLIRMEEHNHIPIEDIIEDTKTHLKSISVMHEKLYQSKTLVDIELKGYIDSIVESLFDIYSSEIQYISKVDDISLNAKQAGSLGLIINELINNTVKYAFPEDNPGNVEIKIGRLDNKIEVEYRDSGVGIPDSVDFDNPTSLGLIVIQNLTKQIDGDIKYTYDNGTCINLVFTESESF